ncbi:MAG: protease PrsW [Anaerolineaceae bacterium]|nr:MAG: protease PrsW [Anaerolineaceae bacterium]
MSLASIPALAVALLIPIGYLIWVSKRDYFETRKVRLIYVCFIWGLVAYLLAYVIQSNLIRTGILTTDQVVRFSAPILEEILKGAILFYLVRRDDFTYFVDGAIYGFTVGIGFAIVENAEYVFGNPSMAVSLALMRVLSTNLIHATASGLIGIALGYSRFERSSSRRRQLTLLLGILIAMSLHMTFNNLVSNRAPLLVAIVLGVGGGFIIYLIIRQGLKDLRGWVEEQLKREDAAITRTETVTTHEASVVQKLDTLDKVLEDFKKLFGEYKTALAREMLLAQAQMGIYKKTAEKHHDEKLRQAAEEQVTSLREKMNENRKKLGTYCMLFLRNMFPENVSPLWGQLEAILQLQKAPREAAGTGVWTALNQRVAESTLKGETK